MRFIVPIILVVISVASFMMFTNPAYQEVKELQATTTRLDTALTNSKKLQEQRDALGTKYRNIPADSLARLQKLLPDNADNIRFIIDLQQMAQSYGISLDTIKFDAAQAATPTSTVSALSAATPGTVAAATAGYGTFNLEFTTTATYESFMSFMKDVESNLRLTDIQSVEFSAPEDLNKKTITYTVKLSTYWLKN
ncbi:MAG: hypothetical protein KA052_01830 [Candidatus Pacebacteria bacterium]|nr:hypothetical protein [Candidatus Paceibacterota bacterium]